MKGILERETYRFLYMHSKKINSEELACAGKI